VRFDPVANKFPAFIIHDYTLSCISEGICQITTSDPIDK
jgi:hypothetical protein